MTRSLQIGALGLLLLGITSAPASASSFVLASSTLDWAGLTFSTTGSLVIDGIVPVDSFLIPSTDDYLGHEFAGVTAAGGQSLTSIATFGSLGTAISSATTDLSAQAESLVFSMAVPGDYQARTRAESLFWIYGSGVGQLTLTVPYSISLMMGYPDVGATTSGELYAAFGTLDEAAFDGDAISQFYLQSALDVARSGVLSFSFDIDHPADGQLKELLAVTDATSRITVPEPSTLLLMAIGCAGILRARYRPMASRR